MPTMHSATQVEQAVAALQALPRHEQCKTLAQMVFDGALTAAQGKDGLYELSAAELVQDILPLRCRQSAVENHLCEGLALLVSRERLQRRDGLLNLRG